MLFEYNFDIVAHTFVNIWHTAKHNTIALHTCMTCVRMFTWWFILISFHFHFFFSLRFALLHFGWLWCVCHDAYTCVKHCVWFSSVYFSFFFFFYSVADRNWVHWNGEWKSCTAMPKMEKTKPKNPWHAAEKHVQKSPRLCRCVCVCVRSAKSILSVDAVWHVYKVQFSSFK